MKCANWVLFVFLLDILDIDDLHLLLIFSHLHILNNFEHPDFCIDRRSMMYTLNYQFPLHIYRLRTYSSFCLRHKFYYIDLLRNFYILCGNLNLDINY